MDAASLTANQLKNLVSRGILSVTGYIPMSRFDTPEYQQFSSLRGQAISISQAAREYNVPLATISRWVKLGIITKLGTCGNRVLVDRADVAYCAVVRSSNPGSGKWLFNDDGTPYIKQNC